MPELAEIMLMRDFINRYSYKYIYTHVTRSKCTTGNIGKSPSVTIPPSWKSQFRIQAMSRGKELKLILTPLSSLSIHNITSKLSSYKRSDENHTPVFADTDIHGHLLDYSNKIVKPSTTLATDEKVNDNEHDDQINDTTSSSTNASSSSSSSRKRKQKSSEVTSEKNMNSNDSMELLFRAGMTGYFERVSSIKEMHKHAHLHFHRNDGVILSFIDQRQFGGWEFVNADENEWGKKRSPCPVEEYDKFRMNVLNNLHKSTFNNELCEVLLDQEYFNGIGNYLRAEICYRGNVNPWMSPARDVFIPLLHVQQYKELKNKLNKSHSSKKTKSTQQKKKRKTDSEGDDDDLAVEEDVKDDTITKELECIKKKCDWHDILQLCHLIPREVHRLRFKYHNMESAYESHTSSESESESQGKRQGTTKDGKASRNIGKTHNDDDDDCFATPAAQKATTLADSTSTRELAITSEKHKAKLKEISKKLASEGKSEGKIQSHSDGKNSDDVNADIQAITFTQWLQCYENDGMAKSRDSKGRTMYYDTRWKPKVYRAVQERKGKQKSRDEGNAKGEGKDDENESYENQGSGVASASETPSQPSTSKSNRKIARRKKKDSTTAFASASASASASDSSSTSPSTPVKSAGKSAEHVDTPQMDPEAGDAMSTPTRSKIRRVIQNKTPSAPTRIRTSRRRMQRG